MRLLEYGQMYALVCSTYDSPGRGGALFPVETLDCLLLRAGLPVGHELQRRSEHCGSNTLGVGSLAIVWRKQE